VLIIKADLRLLHLYVTNIFTEEILKCSSNQTFNAEHDFLQEESDLGADGSGRQSSFKGVVRVQPYQMTYHVFQVYGAGDPTVVQLFFILTNSQVRFYM